ncbi:MAG: response regulator [Phycisphaerae bacterium]
MSRKILVCDDAPDIVRDVVELLLDHGYEVLQAFGGREAIETLKRQAIDLLLLDLQMPSVDGFDVLEYVQEHRQHLPVILLSGMRLDDIQSSMRRLSSGTLPPLLLKPVDPVELLDMVELKLEAIC